MYCIFVKEKGAKLSSNEKSYDEYHLVYFLSFGYIPRSVNKGTKNTPPDRT